MREITQQKCVGQSGWAPSIRAENRATSGSTPSRASCMLSLPTQRSIPGCARELAQTVIRPIWGRRQCTLDREVEPSSDLYNTERTCAQLAWTVARPGLLAPGPETQSTGSSRHVKDTRRCSVPNIGEAEPSSLFHSDLTETMAVVTVLGKPICPSRQRATLLQIPDSPIEPYGMRQFSLWTSRQQNHRPAQTSKSHC